MRPIPCSSLRIAINIANRSAVSEGQQSYLNRVLALLRTRGAAVEEIRQMPSPYLRVIMQWEFKPHLEAYLRASHAPLKTLREIVACYESHPQTMMRYGITRLKCALEETPGGLESPVYLEALSARESSIRQAQATLAPYDAVMMTGPTNIMHFVGLPSLALRLCEDESGIPRGIILYGADERRLLSAALTLETYCSPFVPPHL